MTSKYGASASTQSLLVHMVRIELLLDLPAAEEVDDVGLWQARIQGEAAWRWIAPPRNQFAPTGHNNNLVFFLTRLMAAAGYGPGLWTRGGYDNLGANATPTRTI